MERIGLSLPLPNGSRPASPVSAPAPAASANPRTGCPIAVVTERTRILIGSFRKGEAEDPDVFATALAAVLAEYPEAVVRRVTDPRTGLARRCQWLPTVAEVGAACEREMAALRRPRRADPALEPPRGPRASAALWDRLKAELAADALPRAAAKSPEARAAEWANAPAPASAELLAYLNPAP